MTLEQFRLANPGHVLVNDFNAHLPGVAPAAWLQPRTQVIAAFPARFPNYQVGDMAIRRWWRHAQEYAEHYVTDAGGLTTQPPVEVAIVLGGVAVKDYHENVWAFGRTMRHRVPQDPNLGHLINN